MATTRVSTDLTLYGVNPTGKEIGRGAYGRVFEVDYLGTLCAAKEVHALLLQYSQGEEFCKITANFLNECQIWSTIRHPCIVQFLGVYYPAHDQYRLPVMVMEKMQHSLRGLVENYNNIPLNVKLSILDEVCLGLRYLHSRAPRIVHRDLTPNNILLGRSLEAKITDLGVAKVIQTDSRMSMTKIPGTPDFMPPEALTKKQVYGPPLDVFSYGGVALNVITQQWPEPSDQLEFSISTDKWEVVSEVTRRQKYLNMFTGGAADLVPLVTSCLNDKPEKRPSVIEVSMEIKRVKDVCSQQTGRDGMSPIVWLAEVSGQSESQVTSPTLTTQLEKMTTSNMLLRKEIGVLKTENNGLRVENDSLKVKIDGLNVENENLKVENKSLKVESDNFKEGNDCLRPNSISLKTHNSLKLGNTHLKHLKHTIPMADQKSSLPPPVKPHRVIHIPQSNDTSQSTEQLVRSPTPHLFSEQMDIKWQDGSPAPVSCVGHTAVLCDGKVYIGGGIGTSVEFSFFNPPCNIIVYCPTSNSWNPFPIKTSYVNFAMSNLNNQLITAGGQDSRGKVTNKIFSLEGGRLKECTKMITPRSSATAAGHQGTLIITGGYGNKQKVLASTELFDSTNGQWHSTNNLPLPHYGLQSTIVNNTLYLLGGFKQDYDMSPAVFAAPLDTLSSHKLQWSSQQDTPWFRSAPVSIQGRHLLTVGGVKKIGSRDIYTRDIHMFEKDKHSWESIRLIPSARKAPAVVSVTGNKIVVVGGQNAKGLTNSVWVGSCDPQ